MSMLAEPREKKKWSVDPRGTHWSKDESKFGMKMLQKMGWSKGKGLGANEDGEVEHVKVKHKNDNRGVGFNLKDEKNWVDHQDDFASLLAHLNDHHADDQNTVTKNNEKVTNLEKNSKSQKRVHYQKFTRGKDLSNYKSKDLAAIFGKQVSQSAPVTPLNLSEAESSDADSCLSDSAKKKKRRKIKDADESNENSNHVTSQMSVQEYFAQRMAMLKSKNGSAPASPLAKEETDKETEQKQELDSQEERSEHAETKKVKKKKKRKKDQSIEPECEDIKKVKKKLKKIEGVETNLENSQGDSMNRKKKRKHSKLEESRELGLKTKVKKKEK